MLPPDLANASYPLAGGELTAVQAVFSRHGFDSAPCHVDISRAMLSPMYRKALWLPVNPRVPRPAFDGLLADLGRHCLADAAGGHGHTCSTMTTRRRQLSMMTTNNPTMSQSASAPHERIEMEGLAVERWCVGRHRTNAYLIYGQDLRTLVVDPGWDADRLLARLQARGLTVAGIVLTHAHFDHVGAAAALSKHSNLPVRVHQGDVQLLRQSPLWGFRIDAIKIDAVTHVEAIEDGAHITVSDGLTVRVRHAPGHTRGGLLLFIGDAIFTGDTLLPNETARTDLPGGSAAELENSLRLLRGSVHDHTRLFPGHGAVFYGPDALRLIDRVLAPVTDPS